MDSFTSSGYMDEKDAVISNDHIIPSFSIIKSLIFCRHGSGQLMEYSLCSMRCSHFEDRLHSPYSTAFS